MKKIYIKPDTQVINVEEEDSILINQSLGTNCLSVGDNENNQYVNEDRGSSIWDREW